MEENIELDKDHNTGSIRPMSLEFFEAFVDKTKNPLEDGFQPGQFYEEVPYEYLRGLLSLLSPIYGCMIEKYSRWNGDKIYIKEKCVGTFQTVRKKLLQGIDLAFFPDDIYIIAKCEDRMYVLAFCKFHKDRFVGCLKSSDPTIAFSQLEAYISSFKGQDEKNTGNYLDLPVNNLQPKRAFWRKNLSDVEEF